MNLTSHYTRRLLLPPAVVTLPVAFLFISQVAQLSRVGWLTLLALAVVVYGAAAVLFVSRVRPYVMEVEQNKRSSGLSEIASKCLQQTVRSAAMAWIGGGFLFAILAALLVLPGFLGFTYFLVAMLIAAMPAVSWSYAAGKQMLIEASGESGEFGYRGKLVPLGKKIAVVFIGFFIVSSAALVQLVSSRVSTTLEQLAVNTDKDRFDRLVESANISAKIDQSTVDTLRDYIPPSYSVFLIRPDGKLLGRIPAKLDQAGVLAIRERKTGDSTAFISSNVSRFQQLKDGSILVLDIPWAPFANIPYQISFYTLVITLLTTLLFSLATYFLSRDVTQPLTQLTTVAAELARGNFRGEARIFSDDEVGRLAESFFETRRNLQRLISSVGGSGTAITEGVRVITGGTDALLKSASDQTSLTERASTAVTNVRSGAESVLSAAETVTELSQDASSRALELNASSEEVARSMDYLFQSVEKTSSSTTQMDASAREMSSRTSVLAGIGDEVLSFVAQMQSTVEELRRSAESTAEISRQVREEASGGGTAVADTVEGIRSAQQSSKKTSAVLDELQKSIGQISQILTVIEEVTERTNLLSLNAAIIAAQAGEHGLGFSVVADEIRELADRTRNSTKEIAGIIKAVQIGSRDAALAMNEGVVQIDRNVLQAQDASQSLARIVSRSAESYEMANKISSALEEQAQASRHLHSVTSKMSDHIAEITRSMEEQARGTNLLAEEAERVREIALQVRNSTGQQSQASAGITSAMEQIAHDVRMIRDLLDGQLQETEQIADASRTMQQIAGANDAVAQEFNRTVQGLLESGREFDKEVARFQIS